MLTLQDIGCNLYPMDKIAQTDNISIDRLLRVSDMAERLKVTTRTVYRYIELGEIPEKFIIRMRGNIRMRSSDLESFIEGNKGK